MKYKNTLVISAFPACGKTYMFNNYNGKEYNMLDSDSSEFSWTKDENGNNTKERNPNFPNNYMKHIKDNIGKADVIFVSSHKNVRDALNENGIKFFMIYPDKELKSEWIERFKARGNNEGFIKFISDNWDNFIDEIELETNPLKIKLSEKYPYITIDDIDTYFSNSIGDTSSLWWMKLKREV